MNQPPPRTTPPPQTAPPQAAPAPAMPRIAEVLVTTTDGFSDRRLLRTLGEVIGVVARSRDLPRKSDPLTAYPPLLLKARQDAVEQMVAMARSAGANAVVGLRFDSSEISPTHSEVVAYGTAVVIDVNDQQRFQRHT
ncbi:YbjQ family protein [Propionibacteriaceae bacterium Y1700]|uniref:YbjQ family protein n=1 Tax=Microlunatus sp. Y1700 TaxID=3418487 RepID=UPI003DA71FF4